MRGTQERDEVTLDIVSMLTVFVSVFVVCTAPLILAVLVTDLDGSHVERAAYAAFLAAVVVALWSRTRSRRT